ncbi:histidinol-phosphatase [Sabulilitoribacter arenilitoris]|uniref:Histidinol-phosphatase n=1 Tax=Wocania arenilitoris TaxID=2044858 RepID=A0AAE3EPA9_9FLAO|nr:histidinol-phosphatase [Wocania arenilitoris]MCF7567754.1 histidinol-phosphatase [Wocania arenilitoris]
MNTLKISILAIFIIFFSCKKDKPIVEKQWYKGNLHTHSYWSDGDEFPEVIMDWYKSNGYQFVALTDHNTLAEGEKWKTISNDSIYQKAFKNYFNSYGDEWVTYRKDSLENIQVRLKTYNEYRTKFEEPSEFLILQSEEITDGYNGKPIHINATNVKRKIEPQGGNSVLEVMQNNLNEVAKHKEEFGTPIIAHINHPNFGYAIGLEDMIALKNEQFFEVYNGHPAVNNSGNDAHISTELMWDYINIAYIENHKPLMYGLATDDSHHYHRKGSKWSNAGRGWIMVQADTLSPKSLINAMEAGQFYASTGVELKELTFNNNILSVEVKADKNITYKISFIGCKKEEGEPEEFAFFESNKASFKLTKDMLYVRCKITSSKLHKNPVEDLLYENAWTQPVTYSE